MKSKIPQIIILLLILFLVFFVVNKFFYQTTKNAVFSFFSPIENFLWQKGNNFSQWQEGIFQTSKIKIDNDECKKENLFLKNKILNFQDLEKENKELREVLGLGLHQEYNLILSDIVSQKTEEDSILINQGRKNGVQENMAVITKEKVLVGKVGKVFDDFSQVVLISQKGFSFDAKIITGENEALGIIRGQGNFKIKIELLPKEIEIKQGDIAATSLLGGVFPKNLLIGKIKIMRKNDLTPFQEGEIEPFFKEIKSDKLFVIFPK
ncbi:rod shape-determining protein MreC [Patescibacteria group bacterium]|nr:rod shape-determining protein MreC [Patescibacteria group bacterium]